MRRERQELQRIRRQPLPQLPQVVRLCTQMGRPCSARLPRMAVTAKVRRRRQQILQLRRLSE